MSTSTPPSQSRLTEHPEAEASSASPKSGIRLVPYSPPTLDNSESRLSSSASSSSDDSSSAIEPRRQQPSLFPSDAASAATRSRKTRHASAYHQHGLAHSSHGPDSDSDCAPGSFQVPEPTPAAASVVPASTSTLVSQTSNAASVPASSSPVTPSQRPHPGIGLDEIDELDEISAPPSPIAPLPRKLPQLPRRRKFVAVHSDKTFSLVPLTSVPSSNSASGGSASGSRTYRAPPSASISVSASTTTASTITTSRYGQPSDLFSENAPSSPATTLPEPDASPCSLSSSPNWCTVAGPSSESPSPSPSPSSHRVFSAGLRKIPKTPNLKFAQGRTGSGTDSSPPNPTRSSPPFSASPKTARNQGLHLVTKASLQSIQSDASGADTPNYRVHGHGSPDSPRRLSLDHSPGESNYEVIPASSPIRSLNESVEENYIVHGISPSSSSSSRLRHQFSQESLTVPPLRPRRKVSIEQLSFYRSRSRESLRHKTSLASISSYFTQDAMQTFLSMPPAVHMHSSTAAAGSGGSSSGGGSLAQLARGFEHTIKLPSFASSSSSSPPKPILPSQTRSVVPFAHPWGSQLSPVASESEAGSSPRSRSNSSLVLAPSRRGSEYGPGHRRHPGSYSSVTHSRSISETLDAASPAFQNVSYQDEDGDGLGDLNALHHRPSRRHLSSFFSNAPSSSERNPASSASSRANSFNSASLPAWARLYYGSGERKKLLMPSSESLYSAFIRDAQPSSAPANPDSATSAAVHPHRRHPTTETRPPGAITPPPVAPIAPIAPIAPVAPAADETIVAPVFRLRAAIRKQTSSIWSPHLGHDRRIDRYSIWEPPPAHWDTEPARTGRRNIQRVCFIAGFVFPFVWIIASILPLPPDPARHMVESDNANPDYRRDLERHQVQVLGEMHYRSARWWRQVNRCMSVLGALVLAAVVVLAVIGVRQRWGMS